VGQTETIKRIAVYVQFTYGSNKLVNRVKTSDFHNFSDFGISGKGLRNCIFVPRYLICLTPVLYVSHSLPKLCCVATSVPPTVTGSSIMQLAFMFDMLLLLSSGSLDMRNCRHTQQTI